MNRYRLNLNEAGDVVLEVSEPEPRSAYHSYGDNWKAWRRARVTDFPVTFHVNPIANIAGEER